MTITQFIGYRLFQTAAVTALVSTRIYHGEIPEGETTYPVINYFMVDHINQDLTDMYRDRIQISVRSQDAEECWDIARKVIATFFELQDTVNGFDVQYCRYESASMLREDDSVYHIPIDIFVLNKNS